MILMCNISLEVEQYYMKLQTIFIQNIFLISICLHVQAILARQKHNFIIDLNNNTNKVIEQTNASLCLSDDDCQTNSWCNVNKCECKRGWLILNKKNSCSYKQRSKSSTLIISLFVGSGGIDWFSLSRQNHLYIFIGLLKLLISIAACTWSCLSLINKTKTSIIVASYIGAGLTFISVIWWATDWIRILLNSFPDGNGVPLV